MPSQQDYDLKMPNFKFYGARKQATTTVSFSSNQECTPQETNSLEIRVQLTKMRQSLKTRIHFKSDVFAARAVVDAKAPSC